MALTIEDFTRLAQPAREEANTLELPMSLYDAALPPIIH